MGFVDEASAIENDNPTEVSPEETPSRPTRSSRRNKQPEQEKTDQNNQSKPNKTQITQAKPSKTQNTQSKPGKTPSTKSADKKSMSTSAESPVVDLSSEDFVTPDRPRRSTREKTKQGGDNTIPKKVETTPLKKSSAGTKQIDDSPVHSTPLPGEANIPLVNKH